MDREQNILDDGVTSHDGVMSHAEAVAGRLADRYLLGQLDAATAERFERHFLTCPECLAELETTEPLVEGLRDAAAEDVARATVVTGLAGRLARLGQAARWGLVAALLALFVVPPAVLWHRLGGLDADLQATRTALAAARAPQAALAVLPLNPLRGASDNTDAPARQIRLGAAPGWIVLELELDRPQFSRYRVVLRDASGTEMWRGEELVPDARDVLTVNVHSSSLEPGDYGVEVLGEDGAPVARFAFRVIVG